MSKSLSLGAWSPAHGKETDFGPDNSKLEVILAVSWCAFCGNLKPEFASSRSFLGADKKTGRTDLR